MIKLKDQIELKLLKLHWCVTMQGTTAKLQDWILSQLSCMLKELTSLQSKTLLLLNFNSILKFECFCAFKLVIYMGIASLVNTDYNSFRWILV